MEDIMEKLDEIGIWINDKSLVSVINFLELIALPKYNFSNS
jgi:hypothetical protein